MSVFVYLTPVRKMTCKHWCFTVSDLKMNLCGIIYTTQYRFFLFFLNVTNFHFSTDQLQFNQMSLIPPLPSILVNQSTQEMIMTHCLSSKIAPDTSDITCLSVYDYTALTFFTVLSAYALPLGLPVEQR